MVIINKFKINFKNRVAALSLSATMLGTIALGLNGCSEKKYESQSDYYEVSMDEVNPGENRAVLFNIGNYKISGRSNLHSVINANESGVAAGLIINTNAENKYDIYRDVEYVKYIIENSKVDYPVYLDVSRMMVNQKIRIDEILTLISSFCSKLSSNKIYVGVCGTEQDIKTLKDNDTGSVLSAYDILLLDNDPEINLEVSSTIRKNDDEIFYTYSNLQSIINEKNLNNPENFKLDHIHYVEDGERFSDIAFLYGISVEDLLLYNGYDLNTNISNIDKVRIPSVFLSTSKNEFSAIKNDKPLVGVDISCYQNDIDWNKMKEKVDFAIIRASWSTNVDTTYEIKAQKCMEYNIPMGAYCFNECRSEKYLNNDELKKAIEKQTSVFLEAISGKLITYPVYFDHEVGQDYTEEQVVVMLDTWHEMTSKAGYIPGFYSSQSTYQIFKRLYDSRYGQGSLDEKFDIWIAGDFNYFNNKGIYYRGADVDIDNVRKNISDVKTTDLSSPKYDLIAADVVQITERGVNSGATNDNGKVDIDVTFNKYVDKYVDFEQLTDEEKEFLATIEPEQKSEIIYEFSKFINGNIKGIGIGIVIGAVFTEIIRVAIKKSKEIKKNVKQYTK